MRLLAGAAAACLLLALLTWLLVRGISTDADGLRGDAPDLR